MVVCSICYNNVKDSEEGFADLLAKHQHMGTASNCVASACNDCWATHRANSSLCPLCGIETEGSFENRRRPPADTSDDYSIALNLLRHDEHAIMSPGDRSDGDSSSDSDVVIVERRMRGSLLTGSYTCANCHNLISPSDAVDAEIMEIHERSWCI